MNLNEETVPTNNYPWKLEGNSPFYGWVSSFESCKEVLDKFQEWSSYYHYASFATYSVQAEDFGETDLAKHAHFVLFEDKKLVTKRFPLLEFDGVPFMHVNAMKLDCSRGKQRNKSKKVQENRNDCTVKVKKRRISASKKLNCPAQLVVQEVVRFPDFRIPANTERRKKDASKKLRETLKNGNVNYERRFYILLPQSTDHENHKLDESEGSLQSMDERLKIKIRELVIEGVDSLPEIKRFLDHYVKSQKDDWFPDGCLPSTTNRRYFPRDEDIRYHIRLAKAACKACDTEAQKCESLAFTVEASPRGTVPSVAKVVLPQQLMCTNSDTKDSTPTLIKENRTRRLRHRGADCRVLLNKIRLASYHIQSEPDITEEMYVRLKEILEWLVPKMEKLHSEPRRVQVSNNMSDISEPALKRAKPAEVKSLVSTVHTNDNSQICLNNGDLIIIEVSDGIL